MAPNAYQAAFVADHHDAEHVVLTRVVVADICAGSQSATHAMGMLGVWASLLGPLMAARRSTRDGGPCATSTLSSIKVSRGVRRRQPTSSCVTCITRRASRWDLSQRSFLLDCKPNCMESRKKNKYRDEHHTPLPGAEGDLARSCDEQLLDAFLLMKRTLDKRAALLRSRDDRRADEESSHGPAEQQTGSALGGGAAAHARPTDTEPPTDAPLNRGRPREALRDIPREHPMNPPDPRLANAEAKESELSDDGSSSGRRLGETYQPVGGISAGERALTDR